MTYVSGTTVTPEWNQAPQSEDEVLKLLKKSPVLYGSFRKLNDTWRQRFHSIMNSYIHYGKTTFDTGLAMEFLQEYCLIALDVFREFPYSKNRNEQTAWLSLLATETPEEAEALSSEYPWLAEIYQEIASLRQNPEEVLGMFSEALRMLDQNTMKYMIDEMKQEIDEQKAALAEKDTVIDEKDAVISEKDAEIAALKKLLEDMRE